MSDTIYREDAIKAIEELRKEPHWLHDGDDYRVCGLSEAEDAVKRLPSANSHLDELRKAIENLCNSCDRPSEKELGEIILSAMTFGFSVGLEAEETCSLEWLFKNAPTIDIVRCKECIDFCYDDHYKCYGCANDHGLCGDIDPDDFCSYGEREGERWV